MNLYRVNLNLLVALDILLQKKNVTETAKQLFITQAAMSHNLQQLREIFKDDLLVRQKNYMVLTPYAEEIQSKVRQVLEEVRSLIEHGQRFDSAVSQREFKISMSDYISSLLLPRLYKLLEKEAPHIKITINTAQPDNTNDFEKGSFDLTIGKILVHDTSIHKQLLFKDNGVCIMGKKNMHAKNKSFSIKKYLASPHIAVARTDNPDRPKLVDEALAELGLQREIKMSLPYIESIVELVAESEHLIATIPQLIALRYQKQYSLVIKPLPFSLKPMEFSAAWHQRYTNDLGHIWLREQIKNLCKDF